MGGLIRFILRSFWAISELTTITINMMLAEVQHGSVSIKSKAQQFHLSTYFFKENKSDYTKLITQTIGKAMNNLN